MHNSALVKPHNAQHPMHAETTQALIYLARSHTALHGKYKLQFYSGGHITKHSSCWREENYVNAYNITLYITLKLTVAHYQAHAIPCLRIPHKTQNSALEETTQSTQLRACEITSSALAELTIQFHAGGHITKHSCTLAET